MNQNTSSAVMNQRIEPHDSLDDFPTPPWAMRALLERLGSQFRFEKRSVLEPACNRGFMARTQAEYFGHVSATDVHPYGYGVVSDFLLPGGFVKHDWVITNPPFRLAVDFIERAQELAEVGVAMLVRTAFHEGVSRYNRLYEHNPPDMCFHFAERVIMHKGKLRDPDVEYWDEKTQKWKKPSTATAYCWMVWFNRKTNQKPGNAWLAPCRRELTRPGDYLRYGDERGG